MVTFCQPIHQIVFDLEETEGYFFSRHFALFHNSSMANSFSSYLFSDLSKLKNIFSLHFVMLHDSSMIIYSPVTHSLIFSYLSFHLPFYDSSLVIHFEVSLFLTSLSSTKFFSQFYKCIIPFWKLIPQ